MPFQIRLDFPKLDLTDQRIMVAINMDDNPYTAHFDAGCGQAKELISGKIHDFGGGSTLQPKSSEIWLMER